MCKNILLILTLALIQAGRVWTAEVVIRGNQAASDTKLLGIIQPVTCFNDSACIDSLCERIARYYRELGYLGVRVHCYQVEDGDSSLMIDINEGPRYLLGSVDVKGVEIAESVSVYEAFNDLVGEPFDPEGLQSAIDRVLRFYDSLGYPLVNIRSEAVASRGDTLALSFRVHEGPLAKLRDVIFEGLKTTREEVLLAETGLKKGKPFEGRLVEGARKRLLSLGVFDSVSEPDLVFDSMDTTVSIRFYVREAASTYFSGYAAYAPSPGGALVGSIDLEFTNIGGTLRRFHVLWEKPDKGRLAWMLDYAEPRIFSKPLTATLSAESDVCDTSYASRKLSLVLNWHGISGLEVGLGLILGTTKDRSESGAQGDFAEKGISFSLTYDSHDHPLNPHSGFLLELVQRTSELRYDQEDETRQLSQLHVVGDWALPVAGGFVFFNRVLFEGAFSSDQSIPPSHVVRAGGLGSVRGYGEEVFSADKLLAITVEPRLIVSQDSRIYAFIDYALLAGSGESFDTESAPVGYGLGVMAMAKGGIIRLDIAAGRGESLANARLHFTVLRRF